MKNKKILVIIIIIFVGLCSGIIGYVLLNNDDNENKVNNDIYVNMEELYDELKDNKRKIITDSGEYSLIEYLSLENDGSLKDNYQYSFVDFDSDGIQEILFYYNYGYVIVHYENENLYGYNNLGMSNIKIDGTFEGRTDDGYGAIISLTFDKTKYNKKILSYDYFDNYFIYGKKVSNVEYNEYLDKQEKKEEIKNIYVYDDKEFNSTEFENINNEETDKDIIDKIYKVLELYNGPSYGSGVSFCGSVDFTDGILREKNEYYYLSKEFKTKQELYKYWEDYLSNEYMSENDLKFVEQDNKLYCSSSGKDGHSEYNKEKSKYIIKESNENIIFVIGRVFYKDGMGFTGFDENDRYFDVIFVFTKNEQGNLVVDDYIKYVS